MRHSDVAPASPVNAHTGVALAPAAPGVEVIAGASGAVCRACSSSARPAAQADVVHRAHGQLVGPVGLAGQVVGARADARAPGVDLVRPALQAALERRPRAPGERPRRARALPTAAGSLRNMGCGGGVVTSS